ncbi:glycosyltransferase family 2 protein [Altererythrobacter sp. GH1-8]|uniref:glycosyltransferase family 2 protein n=1 Tax=Altererythrobacter sp. GH1-8 TaxID=3349333 RepID=UPI00374D487C
MSKFTVSIVIPTHNRQDDLMATLEQLSTLSPAADEIIIFLDGCNDGSKELLEERYPEIVVLTSDAPQGSIPTRDTAFRLAKGDLIVSLDDDSYPLREDFVIRLIDLADKHPEVGAFAFREVRPNERVPALSNTEVPQRAWIATYPNCAGAIRKSIYGEITSYPRFFSHAYAEPDFCLQTYGAGYGVLYVPEIEVCHRFTHVNRNMKARHYKNARNEFWSVVMRCPFPHVLWVGAYRMIRQILFGASKGWGWLKDEPKWVAEAFLRIREPLSHRRPVEWSTYWRWMRMARNPLEGSRESLFKAFPKAKAKYMADTPPNQK